MVKRPICVTIDKEVLCEIEDLRTSHYRGATRSYVVEELLKIGLERLERLRKCDLSITK